MENKEDLIQILTTERYISQQEAADVLQITQAQVSRLIKKGTLKAYTGGKTPKPYVSAVLNYKTQPNKKRYKVKATASRLPDGTVTTIAESDGTAKATAHPDGRIEAEARSKGI